MLKYAWGLVAVVGIIEDSVCKPVVGQDQSSDKPVSASCTTVLSHRDLPRG